MGCGPSRSFEQVLLSLSFLPLDHLLTSSSPNRLSPRSSGEGAGSGLVAEDGPSTLDLGGLQHRSAGGVHLSEGVTSIPSSPPSLLLTQDPHISDLCNRVRRRKIQLEYESHESLQILILILFLCDSCSLLHSSLPRASGECTR